MVYCYSIYFSDVNISTLDIITSILYHILFWKLHSLVSYLSYFQWQLVVTVIAVGYLFWTANKVTPVNDKAVTQPVLYVRSTCPDVKSPTAKFSAAVKSASSSRESSMDRKTYALKKENKCPSSANRNSTKKVLKPQLSEIERKKKLIEAMNKFKTKKYWHDSKYERIEGLNWISWK
uniref:Uncharacterized protein n=1 Tax=Heliconius erato TaxID=33431 RepID=L7X1H7_HELEA|nr:hypothetical protein [Heliconius erato]